MSASEIMEMYGQGLLTPEVLVWQEGLPGWLPIAEVEAFSSLFLFDDDDDDDDDDGATLVMGPDEDILSEVLGEEAGAAPAAPIAPPASVPAQPVGPLADMPDALREQAPPSPGLRSSSGFSAQPPPSNPGIPRGPQSSPGFNLNAPRSNPGFNPNAPRSNPHFNPNAPRSNPGFNPNAPRSNPHVRVGTPQPNPGFAQTPHPGFAQQQPNPGFAQQPHPGFAPSAPQPPVEEDLELIDVIEEVDEVPSAPDPFAGAPQPRPETPFAPAQPPMTRPPLVRPKKSGMGMGGIIGIILVLLVLGGGGGFALKMMSAEDPKPDMGAPKPIRIGPRDAATIPEPKPMDATPIAPSLDAALAAVTPDAGSGGFIEIDAADAAPPEDAAKKKKTTPSRSGRRRTHKVKDPPKPVGPLTRDDMMKVLRKNAPKLVQCTKDAPGMAGRRIAVRVRIERSGKVSRAQVVTNGVRGTPTGECVNKQVSGYKFPRYTGNLVNTTLPIGL